MNLLKQLAIVGLVGALTSCGSSDDGEASGDGVITEKGTNECVDFPAPVAGQYSIMKAGSTVNFSRIKREYIHWDEKKSNMKMTMTIFNHGHVDTAEITSEDVKHHIKNNYLLIDSSNKNTSRVQNISHNITSQSYTPPLRIAINKVCKEQKWSDGNVTITATVTKNEKPIKFKMNVVMPIYEIEDVNVVKNIGLGEFNTFVIKVTSFQKQKEGDMTPSVQRTWYDIKTGIRVYVVHGNGLTEELIEYSKD